MVEKLTLFEFHVDEPRFGTNDEVVADEVEIGEAEGRGPRIGRLVLASLVVSVAATVLARRLFGEDTDVEVESFDVADEDTPIGIEN